jgi:predicted dehydrogenase
MPFRFGLIGAGAAADLHARAMQGLPDVEVRGVTDVDRLRAKALAERYDIPEVFDSTDDLVASPAVDAVAILTPHHLHLPAAVAAAKAGKHVLAEKAFAHTVEAADAMIEACRKHGVILGGILQSRFTPAALACRRALQAGEVGRVFLASVRVKLRRSAAYFEGAAWRGRKAEAGGGVLMIQAIHTLDLLLWTLGMPRRVLGRSATAVHAIQVEDVAVGLLEFEGGALAALEATTAAIPEHPAELEIHGDRGTAALFDSRGFLSFWSSTLDRPASLPDRWRRNAADFREQEAPARPSQAAVQPHAENIRDFVAAVRQGRPPLVDGHEARRSLLVIEALYASAATGGWTPVEGR